MLTLTRSCPKGIEPEGSSSHPMGMGLSHWSLRELDEGDIRDFTFQNLASGNFYMSRSTSICVKLDGHVLVQIPPVMGLALALNLAALFSSSTPSSNTSMLCHDLYSGSHITCAQWLVLAPGLLLKTISKCPRGSSGLEWCGLLKRLLDASPNRINLLTRELLLGSDPPPRFSERLERDTSMRATFSWAFHCNQAQKSAEGFHFAGFQCSHHG